MDQHQLNRAINRFPLEDYLVEHGAIVAGAVERAVRCPICQKQKLIVNLDKKAWHCWVCQEHTIEARGGLVDLIRLLEGIPRFQAAEKILASSTDEVPIEEIPEAGLQKILANGEEPVIPIPPPPFWRYGALDNTGIMPYCSKRGIVQDDIQDFGLLWCNAGKYANRLVFPVWEDDQLVYWQARAMWEAHEHQGLTKYIKSLNPPKVVGAAGAGDVLFNLHQAKNYPRVCITEGPIDAIHVGKDAICTFGKKISPRQIGKIARAGVKAVDLMWDGPSPSEPQGAWPEMFKIAPALSSLFDVRLIFLPQGDPGDYSRDQLSWFRNNRSRRLAEFQQTNNLCEV